MSLARYPTLRGLLEDLSSLAAGEAVRSRVREVARRDADADANAVWVPWLGRRYWCSPPQQAVVRELIDAHVNSASPDVDERVLLRRAGIGGGRLADLFRGHPAWGELILPGERAATFRVSPPPEEIVEEPRVEPEG